MFTGLVDDIGTITQVTESAAGRELMITCRYSDLVPGESVAINGACLTVRSCGTSERAANNMDSGWFTTAAVVTTLGRTTIGAWQVGQRVNLERALRMGDRLGGHMVLGHVDAVAHIRNVEMQNDALLIDLTLPAELVPLMVAHGSITVDGVSLTVNALLEDDGVQLSIIEYTRRLTTLGERVQGDQVHVEADVLAKHVERLITVELERAREGTRAGAAG